MKKRFLAETATLVFFFLSGFTSLVYEVVWARLLSTYFSSTYIAVSAVIAAFMFGLALGSYGAGRFSYWIRRPLFLYALFEGIIGGLSVILYYLIHESSFLHHFLHQAFSGSFMVADTLFYAFIFIAVATPALFMGATYTIVSHHFIREPGDAGRKVSILYGLNTAGAVAGASSTGFFLIPLLGIRQTICLAAILNVSIAVILLVILRLTGFRESRAVSPARGLKENPFSHPAVLLMLFIFAFTGFAAMVYEVAWTRLLTMVIGNSVYAFSSILTIFLLGTAAGSVSMKFFVDKVQRLYLVFCILQSGIFFSSLLLLFFADTLPVFFMELFYRINPTFINIEIITFIIVISVVFVPTFLMGAAFPLFNRIFIDRWGHIGWGIGGIYSANTLGGIFGSLLAGLYYIPHFGVQKTILLTAGINLFIGLALLMQSPVVKEVTKSFMVIALGSFFAFYSAWVPQWDNKILNLGVYVYAEWYKYGKENLDFDFTELTKSREMLFFEESEGATVAVTKNKDKTLSLQINGKTDAGTSEGDMKTQTLLSALPLLLHKKAEEVAIIGLGTGVTLGIAEGFPVKKIDCFELLPAVVKASHFFDKFNHDALRDKRVNLIVQDARHYMDNSNKKYDVIISEPSNPWVQGMSHLFTTEFFHITRDHLNNKGIMTQWLHTYSMSKKNLKVILKTFSSVFPYTTAWYFGGEDIILIGSKSRLLPGKLRLPDKLNNRRIAKDLAAVGINGPDDIMSGLLMNAKEISQYTMGAPRNTDDWPIIEFDTPKHLYEATARKNIESMRKCC
ncbi:MAG: fused MFS/spermidine synthase [Proteobacteria bacterium]|nr:fused MFS/spermidine synthase [Pseudomonadota bacterium]